MDKMKIVFITNIVIIIALIVVMLSLKEGYKEQAQTVVRESTSAYTAEINKTLYAQGLFIDEWNLVWELVFESLNNKDRCLASFDKRVAALEASYLANPKNKAKLEKWGLKELKIKVDGKSNSRTVSCGDGCAVVFEFAGTNLKSVDYSALAAVNLSEKFKINQPASFNFNAK